jgi:hypothetical protein
LRAAAVGNVEKAARTVAGIFAGGATKGLFLARHKEADYQPKAARNASGLPVSDVVPAGPEM